MTFKFEKSKWLIQIKKGDIQCPFKGCNWKFFTAYELGYHLDGNCPHGTYQDQIPCPHCDKSLPWRQLKHHTTNSHRDITRALTGLFDGKTLKCLNYKCSRTFSPGFDNCLEYMKHSITCKPLFQCKKCKREFGSEKYLNFNHTKEQCQSDPKSAGGKWISEEIIPTNINHAATKPSAIKGKEKALIQTWKTAIKAGKLKCLIPNCKAKYFSPRAWMKHLLAEAEVEIDFFAKVNQTEIGCPYCSLEMPWQSLAVHFNNNHRDINGVLSELRSGNDVKCPNCYCPTKAEFTPETGCDYLVHAIKCKPTYYCPTCCRTFMNSKYFKTHKCMSGNIKRERQSSEDHNANHKKKKGFGIVKKTLAINKKPSAIKHEKRFGSSSTPGKRKSTTLSPSKRIATTDSSVFEFENEAIELCTSSEGKTVSSSGKLTKAGQPRKRTTSSISSPTQDVSIRKKVKIQKKDVTIVKPKIKKIGFGPKKPTVIKRDNRHGKNSGKNLRETSTKRKRKSHADTIQTTPTELSATEDSDTTLVDDLFTPVNQPLSLENCAETEAESQTTLDDEVWPVDVPLESQSEDLESPLVIESPSNENECTITAADTSLRDAWLKDFQNGIWNCIKTGCHERFSQPLEYYKHLKECPPEKTKQLIFSSNIKVTCCFCQEAMIVQRFTRHARKHENVFKRISDGNLSCLHFGCDNVSKDGNDYILHYLECPVKLKDTQDEKEEERTKGLMKKWLSKFKQGTFDCGNEKCNQTFNVPEKLVIHMENCRLGEINTRILKETVTCQWCKSNNLTLHEYAAHFKEEHFQIYLVLTQSKTPHKCPHFNCSYEGDSARKYISHSIFCPPCILCEDCKCTFKSHTQWQEHDCILNDPIYFQRALNLWYSQVCSGFLRCPNVSCSSSFFIIEEFVSHLKECSTKSKFCKEVFERNKLKCSFCTAEFQMSEIQEHLSLEHSEIYMLLKKLHNKDGKVTCLNYKCKTEFSDGIKYYHHASICKPLYQCSECRKEFSTKVSQVEHQCSAKDPRKKGGDRRSGSFSPATDLVEWYQQLRSAIYFCPNSKCHKQFKTHESLIPHLGVCKTDSKCLEVVKNNKFFCCICKMEVVLTQYGSHLKIHHSKIFHNLSRFDLTHTVRCNYPCKQLFHDRGKYIRHAAVCSFSGTALGTNSPSTPVFNKTNWLNNISNGNLYCPSRHCSENFFIIEHFLQHIRTCSTLITPVTKLPCLVCKNNYMVDDLAQHFREKHVVVFAQVRLVARGICIHCPNELCNEPFANGIVYLQHVATGCGATHSSSNSRKASSTGQATRSSSQTSHEATPSSQASKSQIWYQDIMKGNLYCPNQRCLKEFVLPRDFIQHLRHCSDGNETASLVFQRNELPCCFCKNYVSIGKYCTHLKSCHQEKAQEVSKGSQPTSITNSSRSNNGRLISRKGWKRTTSICQSLISTETPSASNLHTNTSSFTQIKASSTSSTSAATQHDANTANYSKNVDIAMESVDADSTPFQPTGRIHQSPEHVDTTDDPIQEHEESAGVDTRIDDATRITEADSNVIPPQIDTDLQSKQTSEQVIQSKDATDKDPSTFDDIVNLVQKLDQRIAEPETTLIDTSNEGDENASPKVAIMDEEANSPNSILDPSTSISPKRTTRSQSRGSSTSKSPSSQQSKGTPTKCPVAKQEPTRLVEDELGALSPGKPQTPGSKSPQQQESADPQDSPIDQRLSEKLREHSRGVTKRKLTDDSEVIDLVSQLIKRKKKKTRFLHNVRPSTGQWTVTNLATATQQDDSSNTTIDEESSSVSDRLSKNTSEEGMDTQPKEGTSVQTPSDQNVSKAEIENIIKSPPDGRYLRSKAGPESTKLTSDLSHESEAILLGNLEKDKGGLEKSPKTTRVLRSKAIEDQTTGSTISIGIHPIEPPTEDVSANNEENEQSTAAKSPKAGRVLRDKTSKEISSESISSIEIQPTEETPRKDEETKAGKSPKADRVLRNKASKEMSSESIEIQPTEETPRKDEETKAGKSPKADRVLRNKTSKEMSSELIEIQPTEETPRKDEETKAGKSPKADRVLRNKTSKEMSSESIEIQPAEETPRKDEQTEAGKSSRSLRSKTLKDIGKDPDKDCALVLDENPGEYSKQQVTPKKQDVKTSVAEETTPKTTERVSRTNEKRTSIRKSYQFKTSDASDSTPQELPPSSHLEKGELETALGALKGSYHSPREDNTEAVPTKKQSTINTDKTLSNEQDNEKLTVPLKKNLRSSSGKDVAKSETTTKSRRKSSRFKGDTENVRSTTEVVQKDKAPIAHDKIKSNEKVEVKSAKVTSIRRSLRSSDIETPRTEKKDVSLEKNSVKKCAVVIPKRNIRSKFSSSPPQSDKPESTTSVSSRKSTPSKSNDITPDKEVFERGTHAVSTKTGSSSKSIESVTTTKSDAVITRTENSLPSPKSSRLSLGEASSEESKTLSGTDCTNSTNQHKSVLTLSGITSRRTSRSRKSQTSSIIDIKSSTTESDPSSDERTKEVSRRMTQSTEPSITGDTSTQSEDTDSSVTYNSTTKSKNLGSPKRKTQSRETTMKKDSDTDLNTTKRRTRSTDLSNLITSQPQDLKTEIFVKEVTEPSTGTATSKVEKGEPIATSLNARKTKRRSRRLVKDDTPKKEEPINETDTYVEETLLKETKVEKREESEIQKTILKEATETEALQENLDSEKKEKLETSKQVDVKDQEHVSDYHENENKRESKHDGLPTNDPTVKETDESISHYNEIQKHRHSNSQNQEEVKVDSPNETLAADRSNKDTDGKDEEEPTFQNEISKVNILNDEVSKADCPEIKVASAEVSRVEDGDFEVLCQDSDETDISYPPSPIKSVEQGPLTAAEKRTHAQRDQPKQLPPTEALVSILDDRKEGPVSEVSGPTSTPGQETVPMSRKPSTGSSSINPLLGMKNLIDATFSGMRDFLVSTPRDSPKPSESPNPLRCLQENLDSLHQGRKVTSEAPQDKVMRGRRLESQSPLRRKIHKSPQETLETLQDAPIMDRSENTQLKSQESSATYVSGIQEASETSQESCKTSQETLQTPHQTSQSPIGKLQQASKTPLRHKQDISLRDTQDLIENATSTDSTDSTSSEKPKNIDDKASSTPVTEIPTADPQSSVKHNKTDSKTSSSPVTEEPTAISTSSAKQKTDNKASSTLVTEIPAAVSTSSVKHKIDDKGSSTPVTEIPTADPQSSVKHNKTDNKASSSPVSEEPTAISTSSAKQKTDNKASSTLVTEIPAAVSTSSVKHKIDDKGSSTPVTEVPTADPQSSVKHKKTDNKARSTPVTEITNPLTQTSEKSEHLNRNRNKKKQQNLPTTLNNEQGTSTPDKQPEPSTPGQLQTKRKLGRFKYSRFSALNRMGGSPKDLDTATTSTPKKEETTETEIEKIKTPPTISTTIRSNKINIESSVSETLDHQTADETINKELLPVQPSIEPVGLDDDEDEEGAEIDFCIEPTGGHHSILNITSGHDSEVEIVDHDEDVVENDAASPNDAVDHSYEEEQVSEENTETCGDNDVSGGDNDVSGGDNDVISGDNDVISGDNDVISGDNDVPCRDNKSEEREESKAIEIVGIQDETRAAIILDTESKKSKDEPHTSQLQKIESDKHESEVREKDESSKEIRITTERRDETVSKETETIAEPRREKTPKAPSENPTTIIDESVLSKEENDSQINRSVSPTFGPHRNRKQKRAEEKTSSTLAMRQMLALAPTTFGDTTICPESQSEEETVPDSNLPSALVVKNGVPTTKSLQQTFFNCVVEQAPPASDVSPTKEREETETIENELFDLFSGAQKTVVETMSTFTVSETKTKTTEVRSPKSKRRRTQTDHRPRKVSSESDHDLQAQPEDYKTGKKRSQKVSRSRKGSKKDQNKVPKELTLIDGSIKENVPTATIEMCETEYDIEEHKRKTRSSYVGPKIHEHLKSDIETGMQPSEDSKTKETLKHGDVQMELHENDNQIQSEQTVLPSINEEKEPKSKTDQKKSKREKSKKTTENRSLRATATRRSFRSSVSIPESKESHESLNSGRCDQSRSTESVKTSTPQADKSKKELSSTEIKPKKSEELLKTKLNDKVERNDNNNRSNRKKRSELLPITKPTEYPQTKLKEESVSYDVSLDIVRNLDEQLEMVIESDTNRVVEKGAVITNERESNILDTDTTCLDDEVFQPPLQEVNSDKILSDISDMISQGTESKDTGVITPDTSVVDESLKPADKSNDIGNKSKNQESPFEIWAKQLQNFQFVCPKCQVSFLRPSSLMKHIKSCVRNATPYCKVKVVCSECQISMRFERLGDHFKKRHLLLNWYLGELEKGNWAICQNYKCGKYMDDPEDLRVHARKCQYLWKCKYCDVEYDKESRVKNHHCRDTSSDEEDNVVDYPLPPGLSEKQPITIPDRTDKTKKKRRSAVEDTDIHSNLETPPELGTPSIVNKKMKKKVSLVLPKLKIGSTVKKKSGGTKPKASSTPAKSSVVGEEVEQVELVKEEIDFERWTTDLSNFNFCCPVKECHKNNSVNGLRRHMLKIHSSELAQQAFDCVIKCAVPTCNHHNIELKIDKYIKHVKASHPEVVQSYTDLHSCYRSTVFCLNYECSKELSEFEEIGQHFISCGYKKICHECCHISESMQANKEHICITEEFAEPEGDEKKADGKEKRGKRKSAARAMQILSAAIENVRKGKEKKKSSDKEMYRIENELFGDDESDVEYDQDDSDFELDRVSSSSEEEIESDFDEEEEEDEDDLNQVDEGSRRSRSRNEGTRLNYYDKEFFKTWVEESKTTDVIHPTLMPREQDLKELSELQYTSYLPTVQTSPLIEFEYFKRSGQKKRTQAKKLKLFEATPSLEDSGTLGFFCGGDVWSLDWCPSSGQGEQYMAVACHGSTIEHHNPSERESSRGLIQIWYVGKIHQTSHSCKPKLVYGICHEYGPVYDLKWCPANYEDYEMEEIKERLGILALACGDGSVRILSIPRPTNIGPGSQPVFCTLDPVLTLLTHKNNAFETQRTGFCLCVRWHPLKPHRKIAAGFADGSVRIWDVASQSMFLKIEEGNATSLLPIITMYPHSYAVRSIDWCPYNKDIIATVSCDKSFKILHIQHPNNPLFVTKRGIFLDIVWPKTRLGLFVTEDECFNILPGSARYQVLENHFKLNLAEDHRRPVITTRHKTAAWSCSYNDYLDLVATSDTSGDVIVCKDQDSQGTKYPKLQHKTEPVYHIDREEIEEIQSTPQEGGSHVLVDLGQKHYDEDVNLCESYKKHQERNVKICCEKYKYTLVDTNKYEYTRYRSPKDKDLNRCCFGHLKRVDDIPELETRSVHKVSWNMNYGSHTWLASGTRIGLVRLHNFKAWKT
ncbi:uncharacterized protein [Clytia hemisphaerica]|uniref:C2H2-type domain-containing protein n=2 Tax=Clytia hemisphaerica TaxID=252671 RepID=A0A7M5X267_9CNID